MCQLLNIRRLLTTTPYTFPIWKSSSMRSKTMLTRIAHTCSYLQISTLTVVHITKITRIAPYDAFTTHTRFFFVYICVNRRWCTSRLQGLKSVTPFYTHTRFFVTSLSTLAVVCRGRKMKMCLCRRWGSQPHPGPLLKKEGCLWNCIILCVICENLSRIFQRAIRL